MLIHDNSVYLKPVCAAAVPGSSSLSRGNLPEIDRCWPRMVNGVVELEGDNRPGFDVNGSCGSTWIVTTGHPARAHVLNRRVVNRLTDSNAGRRAASSDLIPNIWEWK